MTSHLLTGGALVLVVVILASILGAVDRRERFLFVGGIALFIVAHTAITSPAPVASLLAVVGLVVAVASTLPMLTQSVS